MMDTIIGLEIHLQTKTNSKMFCSCGSQYFEKDPNTHTCPVCMGFPGALPIPNQRALELCILLGLATNCDIANEIKFDRKHYYYPDLPKGYQISQYDEPVCSDGWITIKVPSIKDQVTSEENSDDKNIDRLPSVGLPGLTRIEIERIHQEEDVAKSFHLKEPTTGKDYTLIDYNKSGVPLIEIVSKPVMRSALEAKLYATKIRQIARYLGISDADMEKGQMRCEPNISIQESGKWKCDNGKILPIGDYKLNPKVEVKNIGSISAVEKAVEYEVSRMTEDLEAGKKLTQQTRGWNAEKGITEFQRSKESAEDYRYFKEPDIPTIIVNIDVVERISEELVELPDEKEERYKSSYNLSDYDISVLTMLKQNAEYFEQVVEKLQLLEGADATKNAKTAANWLSGVVFAYLNGQGKSISDLTMKPEELAFIINEVSTGKVLNSKAKEILTEALSNGKPVIELYKSTATAIVTDNTELENFVDQAIAANPKAVEDFKAGKQNAIGFMVGQVMRLAKGSANPQKLQEILKSKLEAAK